MTISSQNTQELEGGNGQNNHLEKELEEMMNAGVHFGYSKTRRHPKMKPFIFGVRNNVEVFDLEKVRAKLVEAEDFLRQLGEAKKKILLVGTKPGINSLIEKSAEGLEMPYVSSRWLGGTLTNFKVIRGRISHFEDLIAKKASGELEKYTKKERLDIEKALIKFERTFGGIRTLKELPDALVIIDPKEDNTALREARRLKIPVITVLNTDCDVAGINYSIPANDSAVSSVRYLLGRLVGAYKNGLKKNNEPDTGN